MKKRYLESIMAVVLLIGVSLVASQPGRYLATMKTDKDPYVVVIDAGHGGKDPGKVGVNDCLEKDINLSIALILKDFLENQDVKIVMTRESDIGLYQESSKNKKVEDMRNRVALIDETAPDLVVSIHQNSYHEEYVSGAQVFYYSHSKEGKELAQVIQEQIKTSLDLDNKRVEKANDSYYLLKKTSAPTVIIECGFLSNYEDASKLIDESYQEKMAWTIHLAILQYLNSKEAS